ncbi:hypothetical protein HKX48_005554 [Thoreauomyces humboldtii]|nr:hypothetical protein HKX48_005554 [Thoreauomyces humboldtii]
MDLGAVIKDFCGVFRSAINRAGLKFLVDVESSTEKVYIDADMWEKIVYNLLSNALKCTLRGSISVHYHHVDGFAEVTIADTGVGIPPEDVEKVFERFHRVEQVYKRSSEGTGIGLALTLELVRLHSGTISLSSKLSEGSSFTVRVPLGRDHLQNSQVLETASDVQSQNSVRLDSQFLEEIKGWDASAKEDTSSTNDLLRSPDGTSAAETPERPSLVTEIQKSGIAHWGGGMGKAAPFPYVLVVDDNRDMASYTKSLLAPFWPVKVARDGQEAWETCQRRAPGLIVSDVMMPRVSGLELVYKIRCSKKLRLVPIILLSARAGEEARVEGLESGADDYLAKPFGARELVARARVHLELGRLRSELMHLGQVSPVAIFRTNQTGDTMYRSEKLVELTGESPSAPAFATVYPDDLEATRNVWYESVRTGTPCKHEFRCLRPQDGKIVHVLAQWEPEFDEDGSVLGYLGAITDITERVTLQTAQLKEAEENRKSQEIFIDMISHEIRNPIAGIAGSCDLLRASLRERKLIESVAVPKAAEDFGVWWEGVRSRLQTATDEESLDAIESCAQHQKMITDDVLNLSKLKSGTYSVVKSWFDPIRLVRNSVNMFRAQMEKKDISFQMKMDWEGRGFACGDPERLTQVIVNLLSNSIKFTANCPHRFIEVGLKAVPRDPELDAGDKVDMEITVTDTGIGMTPEAQAKLFERFSQATIRTHREYGGTGLGLHISKQMIQMMGGTIGMVSELGKGTTFTFRSGDADGRRRSDRVGMVVLIVEDNRINQRVLKRQLERSAYSTITADNGSEAVQIVQAAKPGSIHAILMDIEMPVMGGLAATMAIREFEVRLRCCPPTSISQDTDTTPINISTASIPSDPLAPIATIPPFSPSSLVDSPLNNAQSIPIIGVSGNARHEHRDSALRAGMDAYLVKPHSLEVLLSMIDHWVRKRKSGSP